MKRLRVDLEDLALAFETASEDVRYYLDLDSGDILLLADSDDPDMRNLQEKVDADKSGRYAAIPMLSVPESYRVMMHFIETVESRELREILKFASSGRGAFRRFRDALSRHPGERQKWFAYKDERTRERVAEWLLELGIEVEDEGKGL